MTSNRINFYLAAAESYLLVVLSLVSTLILARLLTPTQIGTFSIAASFAGLAHALRELGVSAYLAQEKDLTESRIRAAFTVSLISGWSVGLALLLISPLVSRFYKNPELQLLLRLLALNFLVLPFGSVAFAYLRRTMQFGRCLVINLSSALVSLAVSVSMASMGAGALALALGVSAATLVTVALTTILRPRTLPWMPGARDLKPVLNFGLKLTAGSLVASANESSADLIIGRVLGVTSTGIFNKALGLPMMINNIIMRPLWKFMTPYFSEESRRGADMKPVYLRIVSVVTGFAWPVLLVTAIAADPIVRLLLGSQWLAAIPLTRILCAVVIIGAISSPLTSYLIANARPGLYLQTVFAAFAFRASALLATVWFNLEIVAFGFVLAAVAYGIYAANLLRRKMEIHVQDLLNACLPSLLLAGVISPIPILAVWASQKLELSPILALMATGIPSALAWFAWINRLHPQAAEEVFRVIAKAKGYFRAALYSTSQR